ncbi:MAG: flagellar biosynthetic protein FliR [Candidatus Gastranaerophilaceae bacterium]
MENIINELMKMFPMLNTYLAAGIFIFARLLGFIRLAPVFNRKEIPSLVKLSFVLVLTIVLTSVVKPDVNVIKDSFALSIVLNIVVGAMIGYMAQLILIAVEAGADMINMQMGLSSAMVLDPTTSSQVSILGKAFSLLGLLIFIQLGGIYWLIQALIRSFEIFPLGATSIPLQQLVNMDYLIELSSNVLFMGLQIASPVLLATLGQDIILGVISKTAPQVNVFQLSFLFKPCLGAAILVWILPMLINIISDYFLSFSHII